MVNCSSVFIQLQRAYFRLVPEYRLLAVAAPAIAADLLRQRPLPLD